MAHDLPCEILESLLCSIFAPQDGRGDITKLRYGLNRRVPRDRATIAVEISANPKSAPPAPIVRTVSAEPVLA